MVRRDPEVVVVLPSRKVGKGATSKRKETAEESTQSTKSPKRQRTSQASEQTTPSNRFSTPPETATELAQDIEASKSATAATPSTRSKHIHFGDDDEGSAPPLLEPRIEDRKTAANEIPDSESDDDEAPEAISTVQAKRETRANVADIAKAKQEQEKKAERRRKQRDAKASRRPDPPVEALQEPGAADDFIPLDIPDLLPESLLNLEAPVRPPTPPPADSDDQMDGLQSQALSTLDPLSALNEAGRRKLKDRKAGPVKVRVLEKRNPLLAPTVARGTRNVRERWLSGRTTIASQRKKHKRYQPMERKGFMKVGSFV